MRQTKNKLSYGLLILLVASLWLACSTAEETEVTEVTEVTKNAKEEKAIPIRGTLINPSSMEQQKTFTGTLEGERQAVIRAKISEAVEKIDVAEGDEVRENAVIVRLDKSGPSSNYLQSKSVFLNAKKNFKKMQYLFDEGAISESNFDGAKTDYEIAAANFEAARQLVELRTPISGTVTSIDYSVGDYVDPQKNIVATVATIDKLRIKLGVSSTNIGYFRVGESVKVFVEAVNGFEAIGTIAMVASSADPKTRTFQVEIEIDNTGHIFKPGMFARVEVIIESFNNILVVPQKAVLIRNNKEYLYVINDGRAIAKEVILGAGFSGMTEIKSGLNPGDTIVTLGQDYLSDNCLIKLTELSVTSGEEMEN
ncbi:MAG: efflux RND transporter periplasmic adaptor subunit [candidate division Zixibacteria bacterium]|nr:efflux RND transporter periplasmic adaptor subunit [candidate division Zixibacteria bacterium]